MKTDYQTTTVEGAANFERIYGEREHKLSRLDFADEKDFNFESFCPECENYNECDSCNNGSNFKKGVDI